MTTVVALGGNALIRPGDRGTAAEQAARLREAAASLAPLLAEPRLVVTHGNGPQVGNELLAKNGRPTRCLLSLSISLSRRRRRRSVR
ncbi:MAG: hypothetical protein ACRDNH_09155 [Gaiellaceae bacterium]